MKPAVIFYNFFMIRTDNFLANILLYNKFYKNICLRDYYSKIIN